MSILSIFIAAALIGSVVAIGDNNTAFATKKKSNDAFQDIEQFSGTAQDSTCGSGNDTAISCNNLGFSINANGGNNANGQQ